MIDREKMDAAIYAALTEPGVFIMHSQERAIYRAGYLAGMRDAAEAADTFVDPGDVIREEADRLEKEK